MTPGQTPPDPREEPPPTAGWTPSPPKLPPPPPRVLKDSWGVRPIRTSCGHPPVAAGIGGTTCAAPLSSSTQTSG